MDKSPIPVSLTKLENINYSTNGIVFEKEAWEILRDEFQVLEEF